MMTGRKGAVLVVGGGIAGVQAALDSADGGFMVYLLEATPSIGGVMAQLDKTFPTNDCAMCILAPKLVAAARHPNIDLLTYSELLKVSGQSGSFKVKILKKARYVDIKKCTGCGVCSKKCPVKVKNEFDLNLTERKAIYIPFPQAVPLKYIRDKNNCLKLAKGKKCEGCTKACGAGAIKDDDKDETLELEVGSIILAPGFSPFDPIRISEYGYGTYKNVITSLEFERYLSPSGPSEGKIIRPFDGKHPEKIAFLQCIGSRDERTNTYCSSVCCMYAIKEAVIAQEHSKGLKTAIFYMDIRAFGKEFEYYYNSAENVHGVRFVKSRVAELLENPENGNIIVRYIENETPKEEEFDMAVLSIGMEVSKIAKDLARKSGITLNEHGFSKSGTFAPLDTVKPGIYTVGAFSSPKDIPDSVAQASGSAALATANIASERGTLVRIKEYPQEKDVFTLRPRIGVFVCHCGINIGGVVDVPDVARYAGGLDDVVLSEECRYACSQDVQKRIKEKITEHNLNRVVVASCSPRTHELLFRETCRDAGLNQYLFEMTNIRDQCSWVHMNEREQATEKSKDLVRMAVAKARTLRPLQQLKFKVNHSALVIGSGISGMTAALNLAEQGFDVYLIEQEKDLGGMLRNLKLLITGEDSKEQLARLIIRVSQNPKVHIHTSAIIRNISGYVGNFKTTLLENGSESVIEHGVVVIATGAKLYMPKEYLYGKNKNIITQIDLEARIADRTLEGIRDVVIIQCIGCRNEERGYCSRVCCSVAMHNAISLLERGISVHVLYKDIRTYGFMEDFYRQASKMGATFTMYKDNALPIVSENGKNLTVNVNDIVSGDLLELKCDAIVLSAAMVPNPGNRELAKMLKVPLNRDGFFLEAHMKLRPVDFATEGVFLCGTAHSPKFIDESISQALGAAARACTILSKNEIEAEGIVAVVNPYRCTGCELCIQVCPYSAIEKIDGKAKVNDALCKGCGTCNAICRSGAIQQKGFRDEQLVDAIDTLFCMEGGE